MKDIGMTPDGNYIMEVGRAEHDALAKLNFMGVQGDTIASFWTHDPLDRMIDVDLTNPLHAVLEWVIVKGDSNHLREVADEIDRGLKIKKGD